ncbi:peptide deformylase [Legionella shakespearei]|uniref:Peptide deformylase n=1 Tax=Legionella shakespearei DSM 23087 TaxID=1122169 RepID=A0A0W0YL36_9GAMM|nr:peptide deformylase [Legionella shakespearei]KTD57610.1 polypeptide deformylase [Legionella shakespearei DSM 23087]
MDINLVTIEQSEYQHVLKTKAQQVTFPLAAEDKQLIAAMKTKLKELGGVGLAAPQINHPKQIIAMYIPEEAKLLRDNVETYPLHIMLNPSYEPINPTEKHADYEGCYSVSSKAGKVPRYTTIKLTWYDEQGQQHQSIEHGFYARVVQHEVDHLNGILIVDRLTPDCVQGTPTEMSVLRRAELPENKRILFDQVMVRKLR